MIVALLSGIVTIIAYSWMVNSMDCGLEALGDISRLTSRRQKISNGQLSVEVKGCCPCLDDFVNEHSQRRLC